MKPFYLSSETVLPIKRDLCRYSKGGAQSDTRAAQVAKSTSNLPEPNNRRAGAGGGQSARPETTREISGMRQCDREVLDVAKARLRLNDDEVNLAGQFIFEPSLNPWLGAALAAIPEGSLDDNDDAPGLDRGAFKAALDTLTTQAMPGSQGTLSRMTSKAPLCLRLGGAVQVDP